MLISSPFYLGGILARELLSLNFLLFIECLERRLVPGDIEVLVKIVQDKFQKLLGILLLVDTPLRIKMATYSLVTVSVEQFRRMLIFTYPEGAWSDRANIALE